ncbi:9191_t:CDS:2, partial [Acaulospora colombiana]
KPNSTDSLNGLSTINFADPFQDIDKDLMDPGLCNVYCASYLFTYAALTHGNQCRCGFQDALFNYTLINNKNCNIPCIGNSSYLCGGEESYTVYKAMLDPNKIPVSGMPSLDEKIATINALKTNSDYLGCIKDSPYCHARAINGSEKEIESMTSG